MGGPTLELVRLCTTISLHESATTRTDPDAKKKKQNMLCVACLFACADVLAADVEEYPVILTCVTRTSPDEVKLLHDVRIARVSFAVCLWSSMQC